MGHVPVGIIGEIVSNFVAVYRSDMFLIRLVGFYLSFVTNFKGLSPIYPKVMMICFVML